MLGKFRQPHHTRHSQQPDQLHQTCSSEESESILRACEYDLDQTRKQGNEVTDVARCLQKIYHRVVVNRICDIQPNNKLRAENDTEEHLQYSPHLLFFLQHCLTRWRYQ